MSGDDPLEQVRQIFRAEGRDLLAQLDEALLRLERAAPPQRGPIVEEMMRAAHNLKGSAGSIGLKATAELAHALESVLREPQALAAAGVFDLLHQTLTALLGSLEDRRLNQPGVLALGALEQVLADLPGREPSAAAARAQAPAVALSSGAPAPQSLAEVKAEESARIPLARLSELMLEVGEVSLRLQGAVERARPLKDLTQQLGALTATAKGTLGAEASLVTMLEATQRGLVAALNHFEVEAVRDQLSGEALHASIRTLRLRPLSLIFRVVPRMARELGRALGKEVQVTVSGGALEVEKSLLDVLSDAVGHLVRNSMDHGLEAPAERAARGKPPQGQLHLAARSQGGALVVELADDGAGVDPARVRAAAVASGQLSEAEAAALGDEAAQALIFRAGLSTKAVTSQVSGRGVGLDAVRSQVERAGGTVRVESRAGLGATFILRLPLQTHRTHVLLARVGAQRVAVPSEAIWKLTRGGQRQGELAGQPFLTVEGVAVPIVQLSTLLWGGPPSRQSEAAPLLVLQVQGRAVALAIDELLKDDVVVVRAPEPPLRLPALLSGFAVRTAGELLCILNPLELVRVAGVHAAVVVPAEAKGAPPRARRVLVVDDSFTMRALEKSILELAGYAVLVAGDGEEALAVLGREEVDLVVSDINMPRRDGFELLRALRQSPKLRALPFILVTSRASDADRRRGLELGASAYVVKSEFDQEVLVEAVGRLAG